MKAQNLINEVIKEKRELRNSVCPYKETKINKFIRNNRSLCMVLFCLILVSGLVFANTIIRNTGDSTFGSNIDLDGNNITNVGLINNINISKLDDGCIFTVGFSNADYITDGIADNVQIQQAINDLATTTISGTSFIGSGTICLQNGTYDIDDTIIINKSNTKLTGAGWNTILKAKNGLDKDVIVVGDNVNTYRNIIISNLQIDGNRANQAGVNSRGIYFNANIQRSEIRNVFVYSASDDCISFNSGADNLILGNFIENCGDNGIVLSGSGRNRISNNHIDTVAGNGIFLYLSNDNSIGNNVIITSSYSNIKLSGSKYNSINGNNLEDGSQLTNDTYPSLLLDTTSATHSSYNSITGNILTESLADRSSYCIDESDSNQDFNFISNNICLGALTGTVRKQGVNTIFLGQTGSILMDTTFLGQVSLGFQTLYQASISGGKFENQFDANSQSITNLLYLDGIFNTSNNLEITHRGNFSSFLKLGTVNSAGDTRSRIEIESMIDEARVSIGSTSGTAYLDMQNNRIIGLSNLTGTPDLNLEIRSSSNKNVSILPDGTGIFQIGNGSSQINITLTSPDGTEYTCGVANGGAFTCT